MSKKVTVAIAGLGGRGKDTYAKCAKLFPEKMEIVAIADPIQEKREEVAKEYQIPRERCYTSVEDMLKEERLADVLFLCTQDKQHVPQAIPALRKGYHLLLEKPISPNLDECREILKVAGECKRQVVVCHVLRYTPFYGKLKELIDAGTIGDIVSVQAIENVGYYHQAHSFVRGNWRREEETSPMILAKCCHDMDVYLWLTGKRCESVSSFGSTYYFKSSMAPEGAAKRCLGGCKVKDQCPYDAEKIYITSTETGVASGDDHWVQLVTVNPTLERVKKALEEGPYGRCVFHCDNDVVDHQVVNMNMEDGTTINFTMCAFTKEISRQAKFMGTLGEIRADMEKNVIEVTRFGSETEVIDVTKLAEDFSGHGGGDNQMILELLDMIANGTGPSGRTTSLDVSVESHYVALAAEKSRKAGGALVSIDEMR